MVAPYVPPTGNLALNLGMCPDWESNKQLFGLQAHAQSTELHKPGPITFFFFYQVPQHPSHLASISLFSASLSLILAQTPDPLNKKIFPDPGPGTQEAGF